MWRWFFMEWTFSNLQKYVMLYFNQSDYYQDNDLLWPADLSSTVKICLYKIIVILRLHFMKFFLSIPVIECPRVDLASNISAESGLYSAGSVLHYHCSNGYIVNLLTDIGSGLQNTSALCTLDGQWNPNIINISCQR